MKNVLLFSRDPGGANCIIPVARRLINDHVYSQAYHTMVYGKDTACSKYNDSGISYLDIGGELSDTPSGSDVKSFLLSRMPDIIVTGTSADDMTEKYLWRSASELAIPSVVILDYWGNYSLRFSSFSTGDMPQDQKLSLDFLPDVICIMDEFARDEMLDEGFPPDRLRVTGQPYLEDIGTTPLLTDVERADYCRGIGIDPSDTVIVFASEPIRLTYRGDSIIGYTEVTILSDIFSALLTIIEGHPEKKIALVLRPHPKEDREALARDFMHLKRKGLNIVLDSETQPRQLMQHADAVVGMSSMFLLEAAIIGKPVFSIQIGLKGRDPFPLSRMKKISAILTREGLVDSLNSFLFSDKWDKIDTNFATNATDNIISVMKELLGTGHERTCN